MNIDKRLLGWGVFFLSAGAVVLVVQSGVAADDDVAAALALWPVVVIALGAGLLLRRTRFDVAGLMLAAAAPGLLVGGLLVASPDWSMDCRYVRATDATTQQGTLEDGAVVDLRLACGELTVTTVPGTGWQLQFDGDAARKPTVSADTRRLSVVSAARMGPFGFGRGGDDWQISLPTAERLDLVADLSAGHGDIDLAGALLGDARFVANAADLRLDLSGATASTVAVEANAARVSLWLPADDVTADLSVNAGAISICAPADLGVRIRETGTLADFDSTGLVRRDGAWESPNYTTATHRADVSVTANVGSVDYDPEGGCK